MGFLRKFSTVDDVPDSYFSNRRYIYGYCERVIDGDTIRVRHRPGYGLRRQHTQPLDQRGISKDTLSIRIYAVDCPEVAKNKSQVTQPYGEQATKFTSDLVLHKMVKITFLSRDQYRRAVAVVETVPSRLLFWASSFIKKDLSVELARRGLAELYTGGGAQYYDNRDKIDKLIGRAKKKRLGQWSIPDSQRISAAEQKKKMKQDKTKGAGRSAAKPSKRKQKTAAVAQSPPRRKSFAVAFVGARGGSQKQNEKGGKACEGLLDAAITGLDFIP